MLVLQSAHVERCSVFRPHFFFILNLWTDTKYSHNYALDFVWFRFSLNWPLGRFSIYVAMSVGAVKMGHYLSIFFLPFIIPFYKGSKFNRSITKIIPQEKVIKGHWSHDL